MTLVRSRPPPALVRWAHELDKDKGFKISCLLSAHTTSLQLNLALKLTCSNLISMGDAFRRAVNEGKRPLPTSDFSTQRADGRVPFDLLSRTFKRKRFDDETLELRNVLLCEATYTEDNLASVPSFLCRRTTLRVLDYEQGIHR